MTNVPISPNDHGFSMEASEFDVMMKNVPLLLSGLIREFSIRTTENRKVSFGRFRMRTLSNAPMFYIMYADTECGTAVDAEFLHEVLADAKASMDDRPPRVLN